MDNAFLTAQMADLREALETIETGVYDGTATPQALEDFKVTVDNVRTGVLALLGATHSGDAPAAFARFHVRRAIQLTQNVMSDLVLGTARGAEKDVAEFRQVAAEVFERIDLFCGGGLDRLAPAPIRR